jgi:hypothetical protein
MKQFPILCLLILCAAVSFGQLKVPPPDKSPMDMVYYPVNYPILKIQNKISEPPVMRIVYSRPLKNGREVYGELVEYGKLWRLGANEATEIELYKDAKIAGQKLKKGRYSMYAIPYHDKWTIIFNKETDVWGAFQYDEKKDVLRVDVKPEPLVEEVEAFTMMFDKPKNDINLVIAWDNVRAMVPFSF